MSGDFSGAASNETDKLASRLLDAVKQCQIRFGGRTELATESDSSVSCLCAQFEAVLQHGLRRNGSNSSPNFATGSNSSTPSSSSSALNVRDVMTSLNVNLHLNFKSTDNEPAFWWFVREFLTRHEQERYILLKNIGTDVGRGRAWLRSSLNEHSLERYTNMFFADSVHLAQFYTESAFMRDQEKTSLLPNVAAGLGSILFAININCADLNSTKVIISNSTLAMSSSVPADEPSPIFANVNSDSKTKDKPKKKRVPTQIVSFDEEELSDVERSGSNSVVCSSAPSTCLSSPTDSLMFRKRGRTKHGCTRDANIRNSDCPVTVEVTHSASAIDRSKTSSHSDLDSSSCGDEYRAPNGTVNNWEYSVSESQVESVWSSEIQSPSAPSECCDHPIAIVKTLVDLNADSSSAGATVVKNHSRLRIPFFTNSHESKSSSVVRKAPIPLTPVNDSSVGELFPLTTNDELQSEDSVSIPSFSEDFDNAATTPVVAGAQKTPAFDRVSSNCSTAGEDSCSLKSGKISSLAEADLRQVLFTVMQKKDELEEHNRSLRSLMEKEMEMSATLRIKNDEFKQMHQEKLDKVHSKLQTLSRENELLKHQLRKYVGAVQMLKRDGTQAHEAIVNLNRDGQVGSSDRRNYIDYHFESTEYEKKLIQVAEMHGELMEFNDRLHRLLSQKEHMVRRLREELIELRGPLPDDSMTSDDDISITSDYDASSLTTAARALINVWIPSAFLTGKSSDVHHVYQVYIRIRDDEWNIYRRYAQFYALHKELKKKDVIVNTYEFPPKKVLGNKDAKFVEERRKRLQHYVRCVINLMMHSNADLATSPDKETLTSLLPFFGEFANPASRHRNRQRRSQGIFSRGWANPIGSQPMPQYTGV